MRKSRFAFLMVLSMFAVLLLTAIAPTAVHARHTTEVHAAAQTDNEVSPTAATQEEKAESGTAVVMGILALILILVGVVGVIGAVALGVIGLGYQSIQNEE